MPKLIIYLYRIRPRVFHKSKASSAIQDKTLDLFRSTKRKEPAWLGVSIGNKRFLESFR